MRTRSYHRKFKGKEKRDGNTFSIEMFKEKGRGVVATSPIEKGEYLFPYVGDIISKEEGEEREAINPSGYRFFFKDHNKWLCIDATEENNTLGRLVNHGSPNAKMEVHNGTLWLVSLRNIPPGEEILYDYGIRPLPWTKKSKRGDTVEAPCGAVVVPVDGTEAPHDSVEIPGDVVEVPNDTADNLGDSVEVPGDVVEVRNTADVLGDSVEVPGDVVEVPNDTADVLGDSEEVQGDVVEVPNDTADVLGDSVEVPGDVVEVPNDTADVLGDSVEVPGDVVEVPNDTADVLGDSVEVPGDVVEVRNDTADVLGDSEEVQGDVVEVTNDTADVLGDSVEVPGDVVEVPNDTADVLGDSVEVPGDVVEVPNDAADVLDDAVADHDLKELRLTLSGFAAIEKTIQSKFRAICEKDGYRAIFQEFNEKTTHVVMYTDPAESCVCDRTKKFFSGIASKCWVLNRSWILDSLVSQRILPENDYEIEGDTAISPNHGGPRLSRTSSSKLFVGYTFNLSRFQDSNNLTKDEFAQIVMTAGGEISEEKVDGNCIMLLNEEVCGEDLTSCFKPENNIPCVSSSWFLDSLTLYKILDRNDYSYAHSDDKSDQQFIGPSDPEDDNVDCYVFEKLDSSSSRSPVIPLVEVNSRNDCASDSDSDMIIEEFDFDDPTYEPSEDEQNKSESETEMEACEETGINNAISPNDIQVGQTNNHGKKRCYDKKFCCLFCGKFFAKLPRHLETVHKGEEEVIKYMTCSDKLMKTSMLQKLRNLGNHRHNSEVLTKGEGELIVSYRPDRSVGAQNYAPCEYCLGYFATKELWKHVKRCPLSSKEKKPHSRVLQNSRLLLPTATKTSVGLREVLTTLSNDEVAFIVRTDPLIIQLGERLYTKHGHDKELFGFIRNTLREMGRLLKVLCEQPNCKNKQLYDFIDPAEFSKVVACTRKVAGFSDDTHLYNTPSLALKIGHSLKKCSKILKGNALRTGDQKLLEKAEAFAELTDIEWHVEVSGHAQRTLVEKKRNQVKLIPLTEDVKLLSNHLLDRSNAAATLIKESLASSEESPKKIKDHWDILCETTLLLIILFNRRRQGEVSKMKIHDFKTSHQGDNLNADVTSTLSELEQSLCKKFRRVEIIGKRGRIVPIILTTTATENLNLLVKSREIAGVNPLNEYLFARSSYGSLGHIRGSDGIRGYSESCGAKFPLLLRSTKLRKQIATLSQVMSLKDNEMDILANFLGHDIAVHREFYRLPEETLQIAKVSKVLLAMEEGKISDIKGRSLDEIEVDINEEIILEDEVANPDEDDVYEDETDEDDMDVLESEDEEPVGKRRKVTKNNVQLKKRPWSETEKAAVLRHFDVLIRRHKLPGKNEISKCKAAETVLADRTWQNVKDFVRNRITALKRRERNLFRT